MNEHGDSAPESASRLPAPDVSAALEPAPEAGPQVAQIRVAVPLTAEEEERLLAYLERIVGGPVEPQIRIDPSILGGVWVRMDDVVIDGTVRARLEALHERLCARCRVPEGAGPA